MKAFALFSVMVLAPAGTLPRKNELNLLGPAEAPIAVMRTPPFSAPGAGAAISRSARIPPRLARAAAVVERHSRRVARESDGGGNDDARDLRQHHSQRPSRIRRMPRRLHVRAAMADFTVLTAGALTMASGRLIDDERIG